jgi:schlafen family protein
LLFPKPLDQLTHDDIVNFANRFDENIRVEYKSTFDKSVKDKIPKVVSSFANSQGGVLLLGINSNKGKAVPPFDGIEETATEEPRLTIENICIQAINPPLAPHIQVVPSRIAGRNFVVVEVESSAEAPHGLENNTKVYIRTGDASNPFTLADVPTVQRLLQRREEAHQRWEQTARATEAFLQSNAQVWDTPHLRISIGPRLPQDLITAPEELLSFVQPSSYQCGRFRYPVVKRYQGGVFAVENPGQHHRFINFTEYGMVIYQAGLEEGIYATGLLPGGGPGQSSGSYYFWQIVSHLRDVFSWAGKLYAKFAVRTELAINVRMDNLCDHPFLVVQRPSQPQTAVTPEITCNFSCPSERLPDVAHTLVIEACHKLYWGFGAGQPASMEQIRDAVNAVWNL